MGTTEELPEALSVLSSTAAELAAGLDGYCEQIAKGEIKLDDGISLLDVKSRSFLTYLTGMVGLSLLKVKGESIADHPVVDLLVEGRVTMEKLKPVEEAVRYQIQKLASTATNLDEMDEDAMYGPNLAAFVDEGHEQGQGKDEEDGQKYRPPQVSAVHFTETLDKTKKELRKEEREKERVRRSQGVQELVGELTDRPEEIRDSGGAGAAAQMLREMDETRRKNEEDYFIRLTVSKDEKRKRKHLQKKAREEELGGGDLRELVALTDRIKKKDRTSKTDAMLRDGLASKAMNGPAKGGRKKKAKRH